ncbi:MAG: hypothetical protein H6629_20920 [Calditrichae bacterium]|nr:hypothetical protein [Calditrichia bacterium]
MKSRNLIYWLIIAFSISAMGQVRVSGSFQTSVYSFERPDAVQQGDFYQALRLKMFSNSYPQFALNTYLRVAKQGNASWNERLYNLYADWKDAKNVVQVRLGRQFVYKGVINGTMDGALVSASPLKNLKIGAFLGVETPFDREMRLVSTDSSAVGGFLAYRFSRKLAVDLSYFQRQRNSLNIWHLAGAALHGEVRKDLFYQVQIDHNMETEKLQGMRYRLNYYMNKWSFTGEYDFQRPRVWEDSYFRIFSSSREYQQYRGAVTYDLDPVQIGAQYLFTDYEYDQASQVILNAGNRWGLIGLVFQGGYAGDNTGVYGDVRYPIMSNLTLKLYGSYNNYQRHLVEISEDAIAFSGGVDFRPWEFLSLMADVEQSSNSFYDNDVRGLFRMLYWFRR